MIRKVLVANRGEIAVRVIRACREMGIETVAVYSEADREALHAKLADEAVCIGPAALADSYLSMEKIISATIISGADAIHPGFGLLSENSRFAELCEKCGIIFIGPGSGVIAKLGNKQEARNTMAAAGVPVIPGTKEAVYDPGRGAEEAARIGYPVMIKAALGGGGKGMRVAESPEEFEKNFLLAQTEAKQAFGDDSMYIEHFITHPRHIEFQILADSFGNVVHLGERDCSIQRNHQKMIEEAPSPALSEEKRREMGETAVRAAKAAGYVNAGTIEFLLEKNGNYYFMEMNTRIQVEHPVTEWITGIDLIKEQIRIAAGKKLGFTQDEVRVNGHAIEVRINAEKPEENFRPCPGTVTGLHLPGGKGIRIDSAIYSGYAIPPYYDSMIAKISVWARTRGEAIRKMESALGEVIIEGVDTNVNYQYGILEDADFQKGNVDIEFIRTREEKAARAETE
ncbi:acetyl-CoA carboxylase biotin carboxylase subunit [Anaerosacchariphilus sp. NSJ-68]|uniref:Biotin carboxylase n=2 Tax=Lachnospiraceae TaxID=186803 RepID=A0A923LB24_9FIRM|nr:MULTISPECIES: acetyl-CoA carboxylase biotin carboxylase subunit [Lachnospiraceae]MBC5659086.1 acetyl-CoA carboxylase biotin carboxylase subunit [Anaerosacchariphilus hominis]MBC5698644.1 acetyl-CoA carboxylase biotin carboxylase subunit [Roseburia difficilis]